MDAGDYVGAAVFGAALVAVIGGALAGLRMERKRTSREPS